MVAAIVMNPLPYHDTKPVGAADFYFAINATFRFIRETLGSDALSAYWQDLGREYMAPVSQLWKVGGLPAVAEYWRTFFDAEPGAKVTVTMEKDRVLLDIQTCPAIRHLRAGGRTIDPGFCQHCYYVSEAAAEKAGLAVCVKGGNGQCLQTFFPRDPAGGPQIMEDIEKAP
jgi:hypothetical protein